MSARRLLSWRWTLLYALIAAVAVAAFIGLQGKEGRRIAELRMAEGLLCPYPRDALIGFEIVYPNGSFRAERDGEAWNLTAPVIDIADTTAIHTMLATLDRQRVERWLPPPTGEQLVEYGITKPSLVLHLETEAGMDTLRFGGLNEVEKRLWVQASWRDSLALVSTLLRTQWMKGRAELADRRPMGSIDMRRIASLEISNSRGSFTLERGARGWEIHRPEPYRADDRSVTRLIDKLWKPTILDFVDLTPGQAAVMRFDKPRATLKVGLRDTARQATLELGAKYHRLSYARDLGRGPAFYLDSLTVSPLLESFSAFMSTVFISMRPKRAVAIQNHDGRKIERESGSDWEWRDGEGNPVNGNSVALLLNRLTRISTERVEALLPRQDQLRMWGLNSPGLALDIEFPDGEPSLELEFSKATEGRVWFRRLDYPTVYSLPEGDLKLEWPGSATP